jgi:PAS domain-containing protein
MINLFTETFRQLGDMLCSPLLVNAALSTRYSQPRRRLLSPGTRRSWFITSACVIALFALGTRAFRHRAAGDLLSAERETQGWYPSLLESLQDIYYRADLNGIIRIISPSCEKGLGYKPEELLENRRHSSAFTPKNEKLFSRC